MARNKKQLLSEGQVRQFMKLANLGALTPGFVYGLSEERRTPENIPEIPQSFFDDALASSEKSAETMADQEYDIAGRAVKKPKLKKAPERFKDPGGYKAGKGKHQRSYDFGKAVAQGKKDAARKETAKATTGAVDRPIDRPSMPGLEGGEGEIKRPKNMRKAPAPQSSSERRGGEEKKAAAAADPTARRNPDRRAGEAKAQQRQQQQESHGRGRDEGSGGYGHPDPRQRPAGSALREQPEDLELDVEFDDLEDEDLGLEDEELGLEDEDLEDELGGGREVSVDDFLAALEIALEDVMGEEVEVSQDEEDLEDEDLDLEDEDLDLEGDELDLEDEEEEFGLQEKRGSKKRGSKKGEYKRRGKSKKHPEGRRAGDVGGHYKAYEKKNESLALEALVGRITRRVAERLVREKLSRRR